MTDQFYNWQRFKPLRRILRRNQTDAEAILWSQLRNKQLLDLKFYRQYGIGRYIVDFYCPKLRLVIELDGSHHNESEQKMYDDERTVWLESQKIKVVRLWNDEIFRNLDGIMEHLFDTCDTLCKK